MPATSLRAPDKKQREPEPQLQESGSVLQPKGAAGQALALQRTAGNRAVSDMLLPREADSGYPPPASVLDAIGSPGQPLEPETLASRELNSRRDLSDVRVHTDSRAAETADGMNALAYTVEDDIVFADRAYDPDSVEGQQLIDHELAHVEETPGRASARGQPTVRRQEDPNPAVVQQPLPRRLEAFKRLVRNAGQVRLENNRQALQSWDEFLQTKLTPAAVRRQVYAEEVRRLAETAEAGGTLFKLEEWLQDDRPNSRWVHEQQIKGRFRACTGCHAAVRASAMDQALEESGRIFRSPAESLGLAEFQESMTPAPRPNLGAQRGTVPAIPLGDPMEVLYPATTAAMDQLAGMEPYLKMLGPDGYDVLPWEFLGSAASPYELVADINARIQQRQAEYQELSRQIGEEDFDYLMLRPIVRELLPLAEPDVQREVEDDISDAETWETIKGVIVGVATIGLLLLVVFPPTSAAGVAGATALAAGLSGEQVYSGIQSYQQGRILALGRGAHNVFDREQQEAADMLIAMGILNTAMGALDLTGLGISSVRLFRASRAPTPGQLEPMTRIEAKAGNHTVTVTKLDSPEPQVRITDNNGAVVHEGPASSLADAPPTRQAGTQPQASPAPATSTGSSTRIRPHDAANWDEIQDLIGKKLDDVDLPNGYSTYKTKDGRTFIRRDTADDSLFGRLTVDKDGVIQPGRATSGRPRASTAGWLSDVRRKVSDPSHPLHFLVSPRQGTGSAGFAWRTTTRVTRRGARQTGRYHGAEHEPVIQVGHQGAHAADVPEQFMLEDADLNILSGATVESRGAFSFKEAVDIEGVPVDVATAQMWERLGLLPEGTVAGARRILPPGL